MVGRRQPRHSITRLPGVEDQSCRWFARLTDFREKLGGFPEKPALAHPGSETIRDGTVRNRNFALGRLNLGVAARRQTAAVWRTLSWRCSTETLLGGHGSCGVLTNGESRIGTMNRRESPMNSNRSRIRSKRSVDALSPWGASDVPSAMKPQPQKRRRNATTQRTRRSADSGQVRSWPKASQRRRLHPAAGGRR